MDERNCTNCEHFSTCRIHADVYSSIIRALKKLDFYDRYQDHTGTMSIAGGMVGPLANLCSVYTSVHKEEEGNAV